MRVVDAIRASFRRRRAAATVGNRSLRHTAPSDSIQSAHSVPHHTNSASSVRVWKSGGMDVWTYFASILRITSGAGCPHFRTSIPTRGRRPTDAVNPASGFGSRHVLPELGNEHKQECDGRKEPKCHEDLAFHATIHGECGLVTVRLAPPTGGRDRHSSNVKIGETDRVCQPRAPARPSVTPAACCEDTAGATSSSA